MKSKQIKLLRKKLEKANKAGYDLPEGVTTKIVDNGVGGDGENGKKEEAAAANDTGAPPAGSTSSSSGSTITIQSWSPTDFQKSNRLSEFMKLFENNMAEQYRQSSWGLNLEEKRNELVHNKARFLVALADRDGDGDDSTTPSNEKLLLAGFCHYRFDYNDDESPDEIVLYVYELQIHEDYRRKGLGKCIMSIVETIGRQNDAGINKVMLTVFKCNQSAIHFYQRLQYIIDEISPSRCGDHNADYELLSKKLS